MKVKVKEVKVGDFKVGDLYWHEVVLEDGTEGKFGSTSTDPWVKAGEEYEADITDKTSKAGKPYKWISFKRPEEQTKTNAHPVEGDWGVKNALDLNSRALHQATVLYSNPGLRDTDEAGKPIDFLEKVKEAYKVFQELLYQGIIDYKDKL